MAMCQTLWGAYDHDKWCSLESSYALFNHGVHPLIFHRVYDITIHPLRLRSVTASCMKFSPVNGALLFSFPSLLFSAPSVTSSCNTCHYWSYAPDTCACVWSPLVVCEELDNSVWIMYCTVGVQCCKVFLGLPLMACFRIVITISRESVWNTSYAPSNFIPMIIVQSTLAILSTVRTRTSVCLILKPIKIPC